MKNPNAEKHGQIYFHDIGDYLSREEKLDRIAEFKSLKGITTANGWATIIPDEHGDWLNQRDDSFNEHIKIGDKKSKDVGIFENYSLGVGTNRDAWVYQSSEKNLITNVQRFINFYKRNLDEANKPIYDTTQISWSSSLVSYFERKIKIGFDKKNVRRAMYRPFQRQWLYFGGYLTHRVGQMPTLFPVGGSQNLVISLTLAGSKGFSLLMTDTLPDLHLIGDSQCFPLYLYEEVTQNKPVGSDDLFDESLDLTVTETKYERKDGISDEGLQHFQAAYPNEQITKEDIFYYTYGLLHSEEYRERYADNLTKELPRIPCVKKAEDFWAFSKAGRELAHWHLNYETVEKYKATLDTGSTAYNQLTAEDFYVEKMKFAKKGEKGTVIYNKRITIKDIPVEAYEYVVNGKPALEWVMERQGVSTHKDSGIVNDANDWAIETMDNAAYPLELFLRVITVSLETMKIVKALPKLDI